jgi:hypothetical protein
MAGFELSTEGYARRYDRHGDPKNNLVFVTKRGYNYDIEIDEQGNPKQSTTTA